MCISSPKNTIKSLSSTTAFVRFGMFQLQKIRDLGDLETFILLSGNIWTTKAEHHGDSNDKVTLPVVNKPLETSSMLTKLHHAWWYTYPPEQYEFVRLDHHPNYENKSHVPNHQPVTHKTKHVLVRVTWLRGPWLEASWYCWWPTPNGPNLFFAVFWADSHIGLARTFHEKTRI